jgi:hypothetical protein
VRVPALEADVRRADNRVVVHADGVLRSVALRVLEDLKRLPTMRRDFDCLKHRRGD